MWYAFKGEHRMPHDQLTEYARLLKEKGKYPLKPRTPWKEKRPDKRHPVATPFLVIPNFSGDQGTDRPLNGQRAIASGAIDIIDINTNASVTTPVVGQTYSLRCRVMNRGAAGCYAGIAEFYVASPAVLNALASGTGPRPAPLGYAGFSVASGAQATVTCQRQWHVTDLKSGILVRAYDPIVD